MSEHEGTEFCVCIVFIFQCYFCWRYC